MINRNKLHEIFWKALQGCLLAMMLVGGLGSCVSDPLARPGENGEPGEDGQPGENGEPQQPEQEKDWTYVWDGETIPEILVEVPLAEWNTLLQNYDRDNDNSEYVHCRVIYDKGGEKTVLEDTGLRLRGNTSRRRPEEKRGDGLHQKDETEWNHCHFYLNFKKFNIDKTTNHIRGVKKLYLKWFKDDPTYVREVFCYDLFHRAGVWTAPRSQWCRLSIHVEGDSKPAYFGVYEMLEPIDNKFIERRTAGATAGTTAGTAAGTAAGAAFNNASGSLWKCTWGADLRTGAGNKVDENKIGPDDKTKNYPYELKEDVLNYTAARTQFIDFLLKLNGKGEESFKQWIQEVCDVRLLLRTYAVNVAVGMWDDHWHGQNNFYLYFDSLDQYNYHFYFIPYDYDNTLGTSSGMDSGRQDPYHWGAVGKLMERMMAIPEFRAIYKEELQRLVQPGNQLMYWEEARTRVQLWQDNIRSFVANDTGEDMIIEDRPASWGNHPEYRLLSEENNFFKIKGETINNMK